MAKSEHGGTRRTDSDTRPYNNYARTYTSIHKLVNSYIVFAFTALPCRSQELLLSHSCASPLARPCLDATSVALSFDQSFICITVANLSLIPRTESRGKDGRVVVRVCLFHHLEYHLTPP